MTGCELKRCLRIAQDQIKRLELNLDGYNVLTELGGGPYLFSPIIPLLANASRVFAWTRDTRYGASQDLIDTCTGVMDKMGVPPDRINFRISYNESDVGQADIITNSGMLRPLNRDFLLPAKSTSP